MENIILYPSGVASKSISMRALLRQIHFEHYVHALMRLWLRRGLRTGEQAKTVQMLRDEGVIVEVSTLDVAVRAEEQQLLALCEALARS